MADTARREPGPQPRSQAEPGRAPRAQGEPEPRAEAEPKPRAEPKSEPQAKAEYEPRAETAPDGQQDLLGAVAVHTAARGFLASRWVGALLMVYSFTHLYVFGLRPGASLAFTFAVAGVTLATGSLMWWRSRVYAARLDTPWGRRGQAAADLFAYTAMVFWLLFLVALWLLSQGVALF